MSVLARVSRLQAWLRARPRIRRGHIAAGVSIALVTLLIAGFFILRHGSFAAVGSAPAVACAATSTSTPVPPNFTLHVRIPDGEPRIVATVNGYPLCAEGLEGRVTGILANNRQEFQRLQTAPQHAPTGSPPPDLLARLRETPNQVRRDALTRMIEERLLVQEGQRLGLTASRSAAQAMARKQLQIFRSLSASDPARVSFEAYLNANHLTEHTFLTDPGILQGYVETLTIVAVRQHILKGLPTGEVPEVGINAYVQHLWQTGTVRVYLPAQLGW